MVDYFALIAPTIESLAKSAVEERRQVYDRLIKMLEAQLRSADPPRSEIDILRERIDLEAAIRRVERRIQAGHIAVGKPITPDVLRPVDEQMAASSTAPIPEPPKIKIPSPAQPPSAPQPAPQFTPQAYVPHAPLHDALHDTLHESLQGSARVPAQEPVNEPPSAPLAPPPRPVQPPMPPRVPDMARPAPAGEALRPAERPPGFPPRGVPRPPQSFPPIAPGMASAPPVPPRRPGSQNDFQPVAPRRMQGVPAEPPLTQFRPPIPPRPTGGEPDAAGRPIFGPREGEKRTPASRLNELPDAFRAMPGALTSHPVPRRPVEPTRVTQSAPPPPDLPPASERQQPASFRLNPPALPPERPAEDAPDSLYDRTRPTRGPDVEQVSGPEIARPTVSINLRSRQSMVPFRGPGGMKRMGIIMAALIAILCGIAFTAVWLKDDPAEFKTASGKYAATEKPQAEEKIADRLAPVTPNSQPQTGPQQANAPQTGSQQQGGQPAPSSGTSAPTPDANGVLTQKAVLVLEAADASSPPRVLNGRVVWKLETLKSVVDNASEIGSRATVEIPEAGFTATLIFRRNRDPKLANSHMIEVSFVMADSNAPGKVRDIKVPELLPDENARGTALSGVPVPVTENIFLVGLNALSSEMQKNLELLRAQNWFAMEMRFANGKRGLLKFEKGKTGERVMEDAMTAWKAN